MLKAHAADRSAFLALLGRRQRSSGLPRPEERRSRTCRTVPSATCGTTRVDRAADRPYLMPPDSLSVPTTGASDGTPIPADRAERDRLEKTFANPQAADDASIARGDAQVPAHLRAVPRHDA